MNELLSEDDFHELQHTWNQHEVSAPEAQWFIADINLTIWEIHLGVRFANVRPVEIVEAAKCLLNKRSMLVDQSHAGNLTDVGAELSRTLFVWWCRMVGMFSAIQENHFLLHSNGSYAFGISGDWQTGNVADFGENLSKRWIHLFWQCFLFVYFAFLLADFSNQQMARMDAFWIMHC